MSFQFEEQLRNAEDVNDSVHDQAKARAVVLYYCSRMFTVCRICRSIAKQAALSMIKPEHPAFWNWN